jgi:hypothetical protein
MRKSVDKLLAVLQEWLESGASAMFFFGLIVIGLSIVGEPNMAVGLSATIGSLVFLMAVALLERDE